jgi:hypothetical protein
MLYCSTAATNSSASVMKKKLFDIKIISSQPLNKTNGWKKFSADPGKKKP